MRLEEKSFYKSSVHVERQDISKQLQESHSFEVKQREILNEYFYRPLRHECEDVGSLLELFKYRENIESRWMKAKSKVEEWNDSKYATIALQPKEEFNKKKDIEEEKELSSHLSIITKILLHNEIHVF